MSGDRTLLSIPPFESRQPISYSMISTTYISSIHRSLVLATRQLTRRMLNLLLGVGGSGTYHILATSHKPVIVDFSPTLWVSACGLVLMLVATAVVVPLNGYLIDRRWAGCLIVGYAVLMAVNVAVEVRTGRD